MSERRSYFSYSAAGSAFGGILTSPVPLTVPTQAMASLSPAGGYGSSTVENFGLEDLLTVRKGTTTVQGDERQTEVTVTLEEINVRNVVTVDRIVLHLVGQVQRFSVEASITPAGSVIEGLRVNKEYVPLTSRVNVFDANPAFSDLSKAYAGGALQGLIFNSTLLGGLCDAPTFEGCVSRLGDVNATLYPLDEASCGLPVSNGGLRIKDFGTLYLGSYKISRFARRLSMLRIELGCNTEGGLNLADGSGNGHWDPPN